MRKRQPGHWKTKEVIHMLWVMTTADKYELPLCVEGSSEALSRRTGLSRGAILAMAYRGKKTGQPGTKGKEASYRIYQVEE